MKLEIGIEEQYPTYENSYMSPNSPSHFRENKRKTHHTRSRSYE